MPAVIGTWSEPPYATIGLGTGTMASYGRPFQHVVFYEIDSQIRSFSLQDWRWPDGTKAPWFNYLQDAMKRGSRLEVIMGDARLSMKQEDPKLAGYVLPEGQSQASPDFARRDNYYRAMEVDAFSSDAIPVHLITKEAIMMYMDKLVKSRDEIVEEKDEKGNLVKVRRHFHGGVLMVHTSNRHVDLIKPVTDVAAALGLKWRVGKDGGGDRDGRDLPARITNPDLGRFGSEYVMIAREEQDLPPATLVRPPGELTREFCGAGPVGSARGSRAAPSGPQRPEGVCGSVRQGGGGPPRRPRRGYAQPGRQGDVRAEPIADVVHAAQPGQPRVDRRLLEPAERFPVAVVARVVQDPQSLWRAARRQPAGKPWDRRADAAPLALDCTSSPLPLH